MAHHEALYRQSENEHGEMERLLILDSSSCCGKVVTNYFGAAWIALMLLIDFSTTYGEEPGEAAVPMFEGSLQVTAAIVYLLALLIYPFLEDWPAWIVTLVACLAALFTVSGIAGWLVVFPMLSGIFAVIYLAPAVLNLALSGVEISVELRANRQAR